MKKKSPSFKKKPVGRQPVPEHLKRNKMTGVRIQQWILDWLMAQPGSSGRVVENALIEKFNLKQK